MHTVRLSARMISMSDEAFEWLWPLKPDCCPRDPLKGRWDAMPEEEYAFRSEFYAVGLIDAYGNLTEEGHEVVRIVMASEDEEAQVALDLLEMEELDELDRRCRRRPHYDHYDG